MMLTLWDLLDPLLDKLVPPKTKAPAVKAPAPTAPRRRRAKPVPSQSAHQSVAKPLIAVVDTSSRRAAAARGETFDASMQAKYDAVVEQMLQHYGVRVRKWRKSMSGVAW